MSFAEKMTKRTRTFAIEVVLFCRGLRHFPETKTIQFQLIKSATSVAANYRAACRARSKKEWFSKISIVVEEIDESDELVRIFAKARVTSNQNNNTNVSEPEIGYFLNTEDE
ncbi:MAG: four helix bundle protein [Bacteroidota bacterium]